MNQLTAHFTLEEACGSQIASRLNLNNTPYAAVQAIMRTTAQRMEIVRQLLGNKSINVSSWYRSPPVNQAVGGAHNSAHILGYAVDFTCPEFGSPFAIATFLAARADDLRFDQIIFEFRDWVHLSFAPGERREALTIFSAAQGYLPGIVEAA